MQNLVEQCTIFGGSFKYEGAGFNFTPSESRASGYSNGKVMKGYVNISNPLSSEKVTLTTRQLANMIAELDPTGDNFIADYAYNTRDYGKPSFVKREALTAARAIIEYAENDVDIYSNISASFTEREKLIEYFEDMGYDGAIHYNDDGSIKTAIAFSSNQFKNIDNKKPTENADIRYAINVIPDNIKEIAEDNKKSVLELKPVIKVKDNIFAKGKLKLSEQVLNYFDSIGNNAYNDVVGDIGLVKSGIDDDIAHGIGRLKAITFGAIPNVIENGKVVDYQINWKDRQYDTVVIAAPITVTDEKDSIQAKIDHAEKMDSVAYSVDADIRYSIEVDAPTEQYINSLPELYVSEERYARIGSIVMDHNYAYGNSNIFDVAITSDGCYLVANKRSDSNEFKVIAGFYDEDVAELVKEIFNEQIEEPSIQGLSEVFSEIGTRYGLRGGDINDDSNGGKGNRNDTVHPNDLARRLLEKLRGSEAVFDNESYAAEQRELKKNKPKTTNDKKTVIPPKGQSLLDFDFNAKNYAVDVDSINRTRFPIISETFSS